MPRTTKALVEGILGDHYDSVSNVNKYIDTANSLVNKVSSNDSDSLLSSSDLELIERWLAAHCYAHHDQLYQQRSTGGASGSFQGQTEFMFKSTQYGQMALVLDVTGYLAELQQQAMEGKRKAKVIWGGTRYRDDNSERSIDQ